MLADAPNSGRPARPIARTALAAGLLLATTALTSPASAAGVAHYDIGDFTSGPIFIGVVEIFDPTAIGYVSGTNDRPIDEATSPIFVLTGGPTLPLAAEKLVFEVEHLFSHATFHDLIDATILGVSPDFTPVIDITNAGHLQYGWAEGSSPPTEGSSAAVTLESVGPKGENGSGGGVTHSGHPGHPGAEGGAVRFVNRAGIDSENVGVRARSTGGNGGHGGKDGEFGSHGGRGGTGGDGGQVAVVNEAGATIATTRDLGVGIEVSSSGGEGGSGGGGHTFGSGDDGGVGGNGGRVYVGNAGTVTTAGASATGIHAISQGGGGGVGGGGGWIAGGGGDGGDGNHGGSAAVGNDGAVRTAGQFAGGILTQSIGGNGGDGGAVKHLFYARGASGGKGGNGGTSSATSHGTVETTGLSAAGVHVQSIGGGGGAGGKAGDVGVGFGIGIGGTGGGGGHAGSASAEIFGHVTTTGGSSAGVMVQSIGGGGGSGGSASGMTVGQRYAAQIDIGGNGGKGGDGGSASVTVHEGAVIGTGMATPTGTVTFHDATPNRATPAPDTTISTARIDGDHSIGVLAQSVGGGGGNGGSAMAISASANSTGTVSVSVALGGKGAAAGHANSATVTNDGTINTLARSAPAIIAQSIGGGGGNGGNAIAASAAIAKYAVTVDVGIGGSAGGGGNGGHATVTNSGELNTWSSLSSGFIAQSVGGGGGNGGHVVDIGAAIGQQSGAVDFGLGGTGGKGGAAGDADGTNTGTIATVGHQSFGAVVQSVGGGGGSGGNVHTYTAAVALGDADNGGNALGLNVGIGGRGGSGGDGHTAQMTNHGRVGTGGDGAHGIVVQSIGGGGGNGGNVTEVSIAAAQNATTSGGGGNDAHAAAITVGVGGAGGDGGKGGTASFTAAANSRVGTTGMEADGVLVQSVGGGGGNGGSVHAYSLSSVVPSAQEIADAGGLRTLIGNNTFWLPSSETGEEGKRGYAASIAVGVGGFAGKGGDGGLAEAVLEGGASVTTTGAGSNGVVAQSIGGGGGRGGAAHTDSYQGYRSYAATVGVGGQGGVAGDGGTVTVRDGTATAASMPSTISTSGNHAHALIAQSVGGGGGIGGTSKAENHSTSPIPTGAGLGTSVAIGGAGGASGNGGAVTVVRDMPIVTSGNQSFGILAQSVGGGGGDAHHGGNTETPDLLGGVSIGGSGSAGGNGGAVAVSGGGAITTTGSLSHAIVAQSVGGGGGTGGRSSGGISLAPTQTTVGFNLSLGGHGGANGHGGSVDVTKSGTVVTTGDHAFGVMAQSVGGGGGVAGAGSVTLGININADWNPLNTIIHLPEGSDGDGGAVTVSDAGIAALDITTRGTGAFAIFAQSVGGGGGLALIDSDASLGMLRDAGGAGNNYGEGGDVTVSSAGTLETFGDHATAIFAQSASDGLILQGTDAGHTSTPGENYSDTGAVSVTQSGTVRTHGAASHGIQALAATSQASGIAVTVDGTIDVRGAGSNGLTVLNEARVQRQGNGQPDVPVTTDAVTTRIALSGTASVTAAAGDGAAIDITDKVGAIDLEISGHVANTAADGGTAIRTAGKGKIDVLVGGSVSGVIAGDGGIVVSNTGTVSGSVSGVDSYAVAQGGTHSLTVDPTAGTADSIAANAVSIADGGLSLRLKTFGTPAAPISLVSATGTFVVNPDAISGGAATHFDLRRHGNEVALHGVSVDYAGAGLGGNGGAIASQADTVVGAWRGGSAQVDSSPAADDPLHNVLLAAANAGSKAELAEALSPFDATRHLATITNHTAGALAHVDAMQSCGVVGGDYDAIREGECSWFKLLGKSVEDTDRDFKTQFSGISTGKQVAIAENWRLGFGVGYGHDWFESPTADSEGDRLHAGVVVKYTDGGWLASATLAAAYGWSDTKRSIAHTGGIAVAESDQKTASVTQRLKVARLFEFDALDITPGVEFDTTWVHDFGYRESGAGGLNMRVHANDQFLFDVYPNLRVGTQWVADDGLTVRPYVEAGPRFALNDAVVKTSFGGADPVKLSYDRDDVLATVGAGISILDGDGFEAKLEYRGSFGGSIESHTGSLKIGFQF